MSRPIKLTTDQIAVMQQEFIDSIRTMKLFDGKVNYTKNFKAEGKERASVIFSATAFAKMTMLVHSFTSEVAWHGVAFRDENIKNKFYITDILVYPQTVTGSTVNTDQEAYQTWLYDFDDDVFKNIRMQGHSHVNFSTTPSGVDLTHQEKILAQLGDDMFYIFMIWNQKFERTIKIFDLANNILYEPEDVDVLVGDDNCDLAAFVKGAKEQVKTTTYQYGGQGERSYFYDKQPATAPKKDAPKSEPKDKSAASNSKTKQKPAESKSAYSGKRYYYGGYGDDYYDKDYWSGR